jgi:hypothetical protein
MKHWLHTDTGRAFFDAVRDPRPRRLDKGEAHP